jgi:Tol biopolymer transport system component
VCEPGAGAAAAAIGEEFIAVGRNDGIHELKPDGSADRLVPGTAGHIDGAAWSPDGRWLATALLDLEHQQPSMSPPSNLVVHDLFGGCRTQISDQTADLYDQPTWTADGRRVGFLLVPDGRMSDRSLWRAAVVDRSGGTASVLAPSWESPSWAPDGSGRFAVPFGTGVEVYEPGKAASTHIEAQGGAEYLQWSKDATRLVFTLSVRQGVWVADAHGPDARDLAPPVEGGRASIYWSAWSSDGSKLAFVRGCCPDTNGRYQNDLWVVDADGTDARPLTTSHRVVSTRPIWSPSGTSVAYVDTGDATTPVAVMAVDLTPDATPRVITRATSVLAWQQRSSSPSS